MVQKLSKKEITDQLWSRGMLSFKLDSAQKKLYELYYNSDHKVMTWLLSRRSGKSYCLCVLALEQCIRKPNSIVKYASPTKIQVNNNVRPLFVKLLEDCPADIKPSFSSKDYIYYFPNGSEIQLAGTDSGHAEKLRGGDCLEKGTLVMTPDGPVPIEELEFGDFVYGYNADHSISLTQVKSVINTGIKDVRNVYKHGKKLFASSDDHRFLTITNSSRNRGKLENKVERKLSDINKMTRIIRVHQDIPCGDVSESDAYLIGAFIGDGCCSSDIGYQLSFSENGTDIVSYIAEKLNCRYEISGKYRYTLKNNKEKYKQGTPLKFNHYEEWIKGKTFLNKNFDWNIVNTWDRESCLKLLAGLIDTDGCLYAGKESLELSYTSCNLELINNIQKLIYKLYQIDCNFKKRDKYEGGNTQYTVTIKNNLYSNKISMEISPFLIKEHKKWKEEYLNYKTDTCDFSTFVDIDSETYEAETYDISVTNETHMYLLANGIVTHNSDVWFVDEAGSCSDLSNVVKSILLPTTLITGGKGILASTPPRDPEHEFIGFIERAEANKSLMKMTIDDNPRLTEEQKNELFEELGGKDSEEARRELFCEIIRDPSLSVIPEFTDALQKELIKEWPRPPFFDCYEAMDIGFQDLTVVLFGYYDFRADKVIIEDELVMNGPEMKLNVLTNNIRDKEKALWFDPIVQETKKPYFRVSDINYIVQNEIRYHSNNEISFVSAKKDDKESAVNTLRMLLAAKKIIIHPKCVTLIRHLKNAKYSTVGNKTKLGRGSDGSHFDALDAMVYFVRHVVYTKNPYPVGYGLDMKDLYINNPRAFETPGLSQVEVYRRMFNVKRRK